MRNLGIRTGSSMPTCAPRAVPGAGYSQNVALIRAPIRGVAKASELLCDHRLQHRLVQAQVGHDLFELAVLYLKLA